MQVNDGLPKWSTAVMVAFDGKDVAALRQLSRFQNYEVGDIAEGENEISGLSLSQRGHFGRAERC